MSIGLKRGTVHLEEHQSEWDQNAQEVIAVLKAALGGAAVDIQHIGSTAIRKISAKPILDIAVAVNDFDAVLMKKEALASRDILFRLDERPTQLLFVMGDFAADTRTHHIHVVKWDSSEWFNYLNFRDYLNANDAAAKEYEAVKKRLAAEFPADRDAYLAGKGDVVAKLLNEAANWRSRSR